MKHTNLFSFAAVCGALIFLCSNSTGALNAYMKVSGAKQGLIKGGVVQKGREGTIAVIAMDHEVLSPRDPASGLASGKRQHKPFSVVVEWDVATPRLYQALFTNEALPSVTVDFWAPQSIGTAGAAGVEVNHMTVKLSNASIASIRAEMLNTRNPDLMRYRESCRISFTYQKIEFVHSPTGAASSDNWGGLVALLQPKVPEEPAKIELR